jgi:nicotianamine synthase
VPDLNVFFDSALPSSGCVRWRSRPHAATRARAVLEAHYSDLLAAFDNPLDHLPLFPYFTNYLLLSQLEHDLLARHVPGPPPLASPSSAPARSRSAPSCSPHATSPSPPSTTTTSAGTPTTARADAALATRMAFRTSDVAHVTRELAAYDVVFLAALVGMATEEKARVVEHLGRHMAPGAALVVRSAHDARGFLYPVVDLEETRGGGFDVLAVHSRALGRTRSFQAKPPTFLSLPS